MPVLGPRIASLLVVTLTLGCHSTDVSLQPECVDEPTVAVPTKPTRTWPTIAIADIDRDPAPPLSLTASDGSGLQLTRIDARAVIEGPLAFTELHLYFRNPEHRIREGTFAITLPTSAAVSRFAMQSGGRWQEAEVVEKALARRIYDDFLHRRQDPALAEKSGNLFTARVFPIEALGDKHIVISYSQALAGHPYRLPLRGLPQVGRVDVVAGDESLHQRQWVPDRDFVAGSWGRGALAAGELVVGTVEPTPTSVILRAQDAPTQLTLLVDTSASRALDFAGYVQSIHTLISALRVRYGDPLELQVIAFDQDSQLIFDGLAERYDQAADAALLARGAAGASDLDRAFATLATSPLPPHRRVVVVTDGVMTAGDGAPAIVSAAGKLAVERVDVVLTGGIRDERLAAAVARAAVGRAGDVYDLDRGIQAVADGLGEPVSVDVAVDVPGAAWFYPRTIASVRAGSAVMVYARMREPQQAIDVVIGSTHRTLTPVPSTPALVQRAVASAEIEALEASLDASQEPAAAAQLRTEIAKRSVRDRVVSSQTSMLVLETEADYAQYHINRTTLSDILVVGPHGLEQTHRTEIIAAKKRTKKPEEVLVHTLAAADLNGRFAAYGATGYGGGGAAGVLRARAASIPTISIAQPTVSGDLDKVSIRRYIKRALPRIRYCYERELLGRPTLAGTITTQIFIGADGKVQAASASGFDKTVADCVADVMRTLEFPAWTGGGGIQVNYPFTFQTPDHPARTSLPASSPPTASASAIPTGSTPTVITSTAVTDASAPSPNQASRATASRAGSATDDDEDPTTPALTGKLARIMRSLAAHKIDEAYEIAKPWHDEAPGDVLALIGLGEVLEAKHDLATAARIYGSIIDLYASRADLRRFAGERLERIGARARGLAIDTYRKAVADRPDHVSGHRLLAYALVRQGDVAGAFAAILAGLDQKYPDGRFAGWDRVLGDDAGMIGAAYIAHGGDRSAIVKALATRKLALATRPSTRFIMYWETDANDVDFHIRDRLGNHAWYSQKQLASGGELYADVTTGYGPECFAIQGTPTAGPYRLSINYYSRGPMGYGMGLLEVQRFDGKTFSFDERPYVIMTDRSFTQLGSFR